MSIQLTFVKLSLLLLLFSAVAHAAPPSRPATLVAAPSPTPAPTPTPIPLLPVTRPGFAQTAEAASFAGVCPTVRIQNPKEFGFSDMERRLICGDSSGGEIGTPWSKVPANEAAYFLKGFFQNRGYHNAEFYLDGDILFVRPGQQSRLDRLRIIGGPVGWDPPKRRLVDGNPLTPSLLDDLQGWALTQIKDEGYPCAVATTRADPATGETLVRLDPGEIKYVRRIETTGDTGLDERALNRYNAFRVGDLYRERLVTLTKRRIINDGFLQTLGMTSRCDPDGATIVRDVILGPSRTIRVGAGGSTELGARVRAVVSQTRIGSSASSAEARVDVSYLRKEINRQLVNARYRLYYSPGEARNYLEPSLELQHLADDVKETRNATARLSHGWNHEYARGQLDIQLGPALLDTEQLRGFGPKSTFIGYGELKVKWQDHDFEFFSTSPRTGEEVELSAQVIQRQFGAGFTAQRVRTQGEKLWNIFRYDPPLLVLGWRFDVSSVFSQDPNLQADLPVEFRTFLGGDRDLRGFERASLPRSRVGALSGAATSFEARLHKVIFRRADIFSFLDSGMLGDVNFALDRPVFMSPGAGVRWESPIGVLRVYGAHRFALNEVPGDAPYGSDWRLGFTYGEEF